MISVFVFAAPERPEAHAQCFASIEASDIGRNYTVCMHPPGITAWEHWKQTHERAAACGTELALVLEDDCLVNRHILHNAQTWRYPYDRSYSAGWLYNPGGYAQRDVWRSGPWNWYGTVAVLYRTDRLLELIETAWAARERWGAWDEALAWACHQHGRKIRVHFPSLAEHLDSAPSKVGNRQGSPLRTSRGTFSLEWRRPERHEHGIVDQWGRRVVTDFQH